MVRRHVCDGEVHFVPHRTDDRQIAGSDGACHHLFIECPQVLQRAPTAANNQCIQLDFSLSLPAVGIGNRCGDFFGGTIALHRHRQD